jgi:hypothetical protein
MDKPEGTVGAVAGPPHGQTGCHGHKILKPIHACVTISCAHLFISVRAKLLTRLQSWEAVCVHRSIGPWRCFSCTTHLCLSRYTPPPPPLPLPKKEKKRKRKNSRDRPPNSHVSSRVTSLLTQCSRRFLPRDPLPSICRLSFAELVGFCHAVIQGESMWWTYVVGHCCFCTTVVSFATLFSRPFGKQAHGQVAWWSFFFFWPYHVAYRMIWHLRRAVSREPLVCLCGCLAYSPLQ